MPSKPEPPPKTIYLLLYNSLSTILWLRILLTVLTTQTPISTYSTVEPWTRYTQTLAIAEIIHSATGITRAPIFTTFTQVFGRCVQVWAVNYAFPEITTPSWAYPSMLLAWSAADTIRYLYFVVMLARGPVPGPLKWLRYSVFFVLYPIGIGSEWWLMFNAARATSSCVVAGIFGFFLVLYGPGTPMMYKYMVNQRRKVLGKV
ncbi:putative membrane protein [Aspergillus alliaceus]|uniref:putative membrane protein n=1 Tax=Petromyces alliaceus TaxID=209559 RepID=UPI0012A68FCB|nr:tyrosine phosphatase-like protein [Aspergillus alliaceus]KAB8230042.1 tyrosine phosphatase-like protein [Aspergillus alliaceus]